MGRKETFFEFTRTLDPHIDYTVGQFLAEKEQEFSHIHPHCTEIVSEMRRTITGGKRTRPALVVIGSYAGEQYDVAPILPAATAVELIHLYALIHDDVVDRSPTRRFKPTTVTYFRDIHKNEHTGVSLALLVGDVVKTCADELMLKTSAHSDHLQRALTFYTALKREVEVGQYLDARLQRARSLRLDDVHRVLIYKTAKYSFERPLHIGAAFAGAPPAIVRALSAFALPIGAAFQIQDDIIGVFGDEEKTGKPADADIREGKPSLLLAYALQHGSEDEKQLLAETIGNHTVTASDVAKVRRIYERLGARTYATEKARFLAEHARNTLSTAPIPESSQHLLAGLADFIIEREV